MFDNLLLVMGVAELLWLFWFIGQKIGEILELTSPVFYEWYPYE